MKWRELVDSVPDLSNDAVLVFCTEIPASRAGLESLAALLTPAERERLARFRVEAPAVQFLVVRAALRVVLGGWLSTRPNDVPIVHGDNRKPKLGAPFADAVEFNVSHTRGLGLLVASRACRVGVDVERHDRKTAIDSVASRYFAATESAYVSEIATANLRRRRFFDIWSAKEAVVKALGEGLSLELGRFRVPLPPSPAPQSVDFAPRALPSECRVMVQSPILPADGFSAAVATVHDSAAARGWTVDCYRLGRAFWASLGVGSIG